MAWLWLLVAGLFEIGWAVTLKFTDGLTRPIPTAATAILTITSFFCLSQAIKTLPLGTAYTVWTGIGALGAVTLGIIWFGESFTISRMLFLSLIVIGILGLKLTAGNHG